jgi:hypothetical protein
MWSDPITPSPRVEVKPEDAALLLTIRQIVDARPTYGYRRITAIVNRILRARGEPVVNAKRVLRIMRVAG